MLTGVDDAGGLRRLGPHANGPLPHLVGARGEEAAERERLAHGDDDLREARLGAQLLALGVDLGLGVEAREAVLEDDGQRDDGVAGRVLLDPGVDLGQVLVLLPEVVLLGEVDKVDDGLGGEELERVDNFDLGGRGVSVGRNGEEEVAF
jgi:hypothetical protein